MFTMLVMLFNMGVTAYILGNMTLIATKSDAATAEFRTVMTSLSEVSSSPKHFSLSLRAHHGLTCEFFYHSSHPDADQAHQRRCRRGAKEALRGKEIIVSSVLEAVSCASASPFSARFWAVDLEVPGSVTVHCEGFGRC